MGSQSNPAISLLVPIYNVERYLEECLESARSQTFEDIEIICINDGSTDGSKAIIESYIRRDSRFRIIDKPNSGYGDSMNRGLAVAAGEYIGILESDDYLEPNALEELYSLAKRHEAEVVKADFWLYWSQPEARNERFGWVKPTDPLVTSPKETVGVFYRKPSIWSALYKREFLEENEIRFLNTPGASYQDAGFNFKVWCSADRIVLTPETYLHYRQDNESSSVNSPGKVYCVCDEYAEMLRYLEGRPEKKEWLTPVLVKMRYDSYMWNYDRLNDELREEFVVRMSEDFRNEDESGLTDYDLFESWKKMDRKAIIEDPALYHLSRLDMDRGGGRMEKLKRYWQIGGLPYVFGLVKHKLLG